jgi:hypothetical protein
MEVDYKGHQIKAGNQIPDSDRWTVRIFVSWFDGPSKQFQQLDGPVSEFVSEPEAEASAIQLAQTWLDNRKHWII